ncbi:hypothetical protein Stube_49620 [Streptomyces tubercidicus]|uniref:Uncharacterized protein n=1 Tax=Streptomyces tubercidicus TaxID=47759 RepID=A0A640UWR8_9ACTN|nr:hypothetical protein Stube_49620 [Streptomyces tubercidicus]
MRNSEVSAPARIDAPMARAARTALPFTKIRGTTRGHAVSAGTDSGCARCEKAAAKGVFDGLGNLRRGFLDNPGRDVA